MIKREGPQTLINECQIHLPHAPSLPDRLSWKIVVESSRLGASHSTRRPPVRLPNPPNSRRSFRPMRRRHSHSSPTWLAGVTAQRLTAPWCCMLTRH